MKTVLAGLAVAIVAGAVGVAVVTRMRKARIEEDIDALSERLISQLSGLEAQLNPG